MHARLTINGHVMHAQLPMAVRTDAITSLSTSNFLSADACMHEVNGHGCVYTGEKIADKQHTPCVSCG